MAPADHQPVRSMVSGLIVLNGSPPFVTCHPGDQVLAKVGIADHIFGSDAPPYPQAEDRHQGRVDSVGSFFHRLATVSFSRSGQKTANDSMIRARLEKKCVAFFKSEDPLRGPEHIGMRHSCSLGVCILYCKFPESQNSTATAPKT